MTSARATVKIAFNLAAKVARNVFFGIHEPTQAFGLFALKIQQHFLGQRIGQAKRDKVGSPFALDVRQVTTRVNAGAKPVGGFILRSAGTELMIGAFQAGIRLVWSASRHVRSVANWPVKGQRNASFVARTSKSAVSPISQSAERGRVERVGLADGARVWKPAIQQTRRSALRPRTWKSGLRGCGVRSFSYATCISWLLLLLSAFIATAQTPPNVSYFRSYVNDLPDQPLVMVTVTGAVGVACFTIEETLPSPALAVSVSGDGVWLPSIGAIRWGPYFNTVATNVSYRLTGLTGSYPVNGGSWMDGHWYFSPGVTMVPVLPPGGGGGVPTAPPQVVPPTFAPVSGASVPTNVTISCATTGAVIYYTLDGSLPTQASTLYTGAVYLASASTVRAVGFTNGWTPSAASVAYYGPLVAPAAAQVTRSVNTNPPTAPVVTFSVVPGTNATCVAVTEALPLGLSATNVTAGGNYVASNNVVLWGPFFGTNAQILSYQAVGHAGAYPVRASWSVDGVGGGESVGTNIVVTSATPSVVPTPPPQVAPPVFSPASGSNVPVNVTVSCVTTGAVIYYTLDGSLPTQASTLYTGAVYLASASTVRAVGLTNGWTPSVASVAYYGPPAAPAAVQVTRSVNTNTPTAPVVTFSLVPGGNASCVAVTEVLPAGLAATSVTSGGSYIASNNVVLWGPFFGTNALALSYQAVGQAGTYPARATWSVDGVGGGEAVGTNLVVAPGPGSGFPPPRPQEPMPTLTPAIESNLPVNVSISSSDPQAQIYYTTDGSLPTQGSTPYTDPQSVV